MQEPVILYPCYFTSAPPNANGSLMGRPDERSKTSPVPSGIKNMSRMSVFSVYIPALFSMSFSRNEPGPSPCFLSKKAPPSISLSPKDDGTSKAGPAGRGEDYPIGIRHLFATVVKDIILCGAPLVLVRKAPREEMRVLMSCRYPTYPIDISCMPVKKKVDPTRLRL